MRRTRIKRMVLSAVTVFLTMTSLAYAADWQTSFNLVQAIQQQDVAKVKSMLASGVDPSASLNDASALYYAVGVNNAAIVKMLLDKGANPNAGYWGKGAPAHCPLILAAGPKVGNYAIVKLLLEAGADVNWGKTGNPNNCQTALCSAKLAKNKPIIELLQNYGGKEY